MLLIKYIMIGNALPNLSAKVVNYFGLSKKKMFFCCFKVIEYPNVIRG